MEGLVGQETSSDVRSIGRTQGRDLKIGVTKEVRRPVTKHSPS